MGMDIDPQMLGVIAGTVGGLAMASRQKSPSMPAMPNPDEVPGSQAAKTPDAQSTLNGMSGTGQAGGAQGIAQTFLTGAGGVDPKTLKLLGQKLYGTNGAG